MSSGDELDTRKVKASRSDLAHCIPSVLSSRHSEKKELGAAKEDKPRTRADTLVPPRSPTMAASEAQASILRDESNPQSLRTAHETFVRMLREKHAAEKTELLKRIERLEKDARRREREIKGLRWLIMNTSTQPGGGGASGISIEDQVIMGRLRSGSKASEFSIASLSSDKSRSSSLMLAAEREREETQESTGRNSVEEGLKDLQDTVSDLIVPSSSMGDHQSRVRPDSPPESAMRQSPNSSPEMRALKQSRRASSPVMSRPGLGFDIPTIPGSDSDVTLNSAEMTSIPSSLSVSNTASSGLSVIPEVTPVIEKDGERAVAKDERRASRILKRLSTTSQAAYAANLKLGMSPSIEQVLDRTKEIEPSGMDDVLRKLRAFSGVPSS